MPDDKQNIKELREKFKQEISEYQKVLSLYKKKTLALKPEQKTDVDSLKSNLTELNSILSHGDELNSLIKEFIEKKRNYNINKKALKKLSRKLNKYSSNPFSRFISNFRGKWFDRNQTYRRNFIKKLVKLEDVIKEFQEFILKADTIDVSVRNKFEHSVLRESVRLIAEYNAYNKFSTSMENEFEPQDFSRKTHLKKNKDENISFQEPVSKVEVKNEILHSNLEKLQPSSSSVDQEGIIEAIKSHRHPFTSDNVHLTTYLYVLIKEQTILRLKTYSGTELYNYFSSIVDWLNQNNVFLDSNPTFYEILGAVESLFLNKFGNEGLNKPSLIELKSSLDSLFGSFVVGNMMIDRKLFENFLNDNFSSIDIVEVLSSNFRTSDVEDLKYDYESEPSKTTESIDSKTEPGADASFEDERVARLNYSNLIKEAGFLNRLWLRLKNKLNIGDSSSFKSDVYELLNHVLDDVDDLMDKLEDPNVDLSTMGGDFQKINENVLGLKMVFDDYRQVRNHSTLDLPVKPPVRKRYQ